MNKKGTKYKLLLVDDHSLINQALSTVLINYGFDIIDTVLSGEEAIEVIKKQKPDLILLDLYMKGLDGFQTAALIKEKNPDIKIIIMSAFCDEKNIANIFQTPIDGYILKDSSIEKLISSINAVLSNNFILSNEVATKVFNIFKNYRINQVHDIDINLTLREKEIIKLVSNGQTNASIAKALFISEKTVKNHLQNIFKKLKVQDRAEAVAKCIKNGII